MAKLSDEDVAEIKQRYTPRHRWRKSSPYRYSSWGAPGRRSGAWASNAQELADEFGIDVS